MTETKQNSLGTEPIGRLLLKFSVPTALTLMVNCLYNIVDQIYIGHAVGIKGVAATNVTFPDRYHCGGAGAFDWGRLCRKHQPAPWQRGAGGGRPYLCERGYASVRRRDTAFGVGCIFARQLVVFFGASPSVVAAAVLYMSIILWDSPSACAIWHLRQLSARTAIRSI